jgi:membrane protease subunit HflC
MRFRWLALIGLILLLLALRSAIMFVDETEYAYVTQFGRPVATYDGRTDAGLALKLPWPVQSVTRFDRRVMLFHLPAQEFLIRDRDEATGSEKPLPLTFDFFVGWRIGRLADPDRDREALDQFVRSFGTLERAESFLRSQLMSRLKIELGEVSFAEIINTDARRLRIASLLQRVRTQPYALDDSPNQPLSLEQRAERVGIAIVDVGLRRFNHPVQVRTEIFAKIQEERRREANNYRLQGEETAARIRAEGDLEARRLRAETEGERIRKEGQAEAEATRLLAAGHQAAPELYRLIRTLKSYKAMFGDDKTQLILSLDHPLLRLFKDLPDGVAPGNGQAKPPAGKE